MQSQARRQRRQYELWLKKNNPVAYREWKSNSIQRGREMHQQFTDSIMDRMNENLEVQQAKLIERLEAEGKTKEEIDIAVSEWVSRLKIWGSDETPKRYREIVKERKERESA